MVRFFTCESFFQRRIAPCDDALTYIALGVDKTDFKLKYISDYIGR